MTSKIMDKSWMHMSRRGLKFWQGVESFLTFASQKLSSDGLTFCPCEKCRNKMQKPLDIIRDDLLQFGFVQGYTNWVLHGERPITSSSTGTTIEVKPLYPGCENYTNLSAMEELFKFKHEYSLSDECFNRMLEIICSLLPEGHTCPESIEEARRLAAKHGLSAAAGDSESNDSG